MVVCPTGNGLCLAFFKKMRMAAEDIRLPRVNPVGPIRCPGIPSLSSEKPVAIIVVIKKACPVRTATGFLCQAARPSLWALIATASGKKMRETAVNLTR